MPPSSTAPVRAVGHAAADAVAEVALPVAVEVAPTVGPYRVGGADPAFRLGSAGLWRAVRTAAGPASLLLRPADGRPWRSDRGGVRWPQAVRAEAWGPGAAQAVAAVPAWLGVDDPGGALRTAGHPLVARLARQHAAVRFGRDPGVVAVLVRTVLEQRVTTVEAHRSYRALARAFGAAAPGPGAAAGLRLGPDPDRIAELAYHELHRFGIERRRAETLRRVCRSATRLDALAAAAVAGPRQGPDGAALLTALAAVAGVGPWTRAIAAQLVLGDPDAVIVGDYHLPHLVSWRLAGEPRGDDARMLELLAPFAGQRGRVVRLLVLDGRYAPRRGPKAPLRSIARM